MFISVMVFSLSVGSWVNPTQASPNVCPDFVLVGARGSGEETPHQLLSNKGKNIDSNSPSQISSYKAWMGQTIGLLYQELITMTDTPFVPFNPENTNQKIPGKSSIAWLSYGVFNYQTLYLALGTPNPFNRKKTRDYTGEVTEVNIGLLKTALRSYSDRCPNSKFFLAGYSQGAAIIRLAVDQLSPTDDADILKRILGVVLIADPLLSPRDKRLAVSSDGRWTGTISSCGVLRLFRTFFAECSVTEESEVVNIAIKTASLSSIFLCITQRGCDNSIAVDVELLKAVKFDSTLDISSKTGVKEIVSVCYVGDIVCSPLGQRSKTAWANIVIKTPIEIHSAEYKKPSTSSAIARWIEKRMPPKTIKSSAVSKGKLIIEDWFGKGWIGSDSSCKSILKIANAATSGELKVWNDWKEMRVIALNPSTGTLLTVTLSENSGDPLPPMFTGGSSTKGKWIGFEDFWDMVDASGNYWAPYGLSYKNSKFTCAKW